MQEHINEVDDLIAAALSGASTDADWEALRQWAGTEPRRSALVDQMMLLRTGQRFRAASDSVEQRAAWRELAAKISVAQRASNTQPMSSLGGMTRSGMFRRMSSILPARAEWTRRLVYAGATVGAVVLAVFMVRGASSSYPSRPAGHLYQTAAGQRATISLADGSRVVLAPNTRLVISGSFGARERFVSLSGEAYFDVAPTPKAPFVVQTGSVATRVLGTRFDVRHYPYDAYVRVAVATGRVVTGGRGGGAILSQGMVARVTDSTTYTTVSSELDDIAGWVDGRLVFKNTPVSTVLATVGQWYGYQIRLADSTAANDIVTTTLDINTQDKTLTALEVLLDVTRSIRDTTITLYPRKRSSLQRPVKDVRSILTRSHEVGR